MVHWGTESCDPPTPTTDMDGYFRRVLIESAGIVGLSRVSEDNIEEWLWRFAYLRTVVGRDIGCVIIGGEERKWHKVTPQILRRWAGLWTNWPTLTRHAFVRLRQERLEEECTAEVRCLLEGEALEKKRKPRKRRAKA